MKADPHYTYNPCYEQNQSFNGLVSWLHSFRYRHITQAIAPAAPNGRPMQVLDIGCGFGKLYEVLGNAFDIRYTGVDPQPAYLDGALKRYGSRPNFRAFNASANDPEIYDRQYDAIVALETLEHIEGPTAVRIIERFAEAHPKRFICSVPIEIGPSLLIKNFGSALMGYSRHKGYTWPQTFAAGFYQLDKLPRHTTSHRGFDWRWLAQTIRDNFQIIETRFFPLTFMPSLVNTSAFFISSPR